MRTAAAASRGRCPITVVSGLPRSGTSLMMQLLAAAGLPLLHDGRRPPDVSNPCGYFELEAVKRTRRDATWVERAHGHAVKVIHALLADLPRDRTYRVIWMERPAAQVVASQNAMLARLGRAGEGELSDRALERACVAEARRARDLLEEAGCFTWTSVPYGELVREPRPWIEALLRFLELDVPPGPLAACVRPELHRQR